MEQKEQLKRAFMALPVIAHAYYVTVTNAVLYETEFLFSQGGTNVKVAIEDAMVVRLYYQFPDEPFRDAANFWRLHDANDGHFQDGYRDAVEALTSYFGEVLYG